MKVDLENEKSEAVAKQDAAVAKKQSEVDNLNKVGQVNGSCVFTFLEFLVVFRLIDSFEMHEWMWGLNYVKQFFCDIYFL